MCIVNSIDCKGLHMVGIFKRASISTGLSQLYSSMNSELIQRFTSLDQIFFDPFFVGHLYGHAITSVRDVDGDEMSFGDVAMVFLPAFQKSSGASKQTVLALLDTVRKSPDFAVGVETSVLYREAMANPESAMCSDPKYAEAVRQVEAGHPEFIKTISGADYMVPGANIRTTWYLEMIFFTPLETRHQKILRA